MENWVVVVFDLLLLLAFIRCQSIHLQTSSAGLRDDHTFKTTESWTTGLRTRLLDSGWNEDSVEGALLILSTCEFVPLCSAWVHLESVDVWISTVTRLLCAPGFVNMATHVKAV
ncbi:hypothetical protein BV22DRAFT_403324 [Leucogyrophana mollusca]|uniref:Uncharacterized protein n=1 Tax=Leucogyrophana mollusca TaxID=85980 RepID=A0ACB8BJE0_9AGAM|nr:hypothetical protein BV22DRAFT_403324 [Leucogyrophana mollusca]